MVIDDLIEIAEKERASRKKHVVRCCMAAGCMSSNSKGVKEGLEKAVKEAGLEDQVEVRGVGCMKLCCQGSLVQVDSAADGATVEIRAAGQGPLYQKVTPEDAASLIGTLKGGKTKVQIGDPKDPFFTEQMSIVLANSGIVDPERIEAYIAADGYQALHDVLREMTPKDVLDAMIRSGLRGRGGAGYPTGLKWATVAKTASQQKYVICNADEGDPGAFMDRSVLESDPHSVLEGMAIAAYAVGATQGFIYVRAEYPLAINRLQGAIKQAKQLGLLGSGIFESPFSFNIDLRIGAGAFVCGEETALMSSVEGKRGTPRPRPRCSALAFDGTHQRCFFAADKRARADAQIDVKAEGRFKNSASQQAQLLGLLDGALQLVDRQRIFGAHVDETLGSADGIGGDGHAFQHAVRVAFQDAAVHE